MNARITGSQYYFLSVLFFSSSGKVIFWYFTSERDRGSNSKLGLTYAWLLLARGSQRNHRSPAELFLR